MSKNYKATFRHQLNYEPTTQNKSAVLLISVGQNYHEDSKLLATIQLLNRSKFNNVTIMLADTLQRYNYYHLVDEKNAYQQALLEGDQWIKRNESILKQLSISYKITRWDENLSRSSYSIHKDMVKQAYSKNVLYQQAINGTIEKFIHRLAKRQLEIDTSEIYKSALSYLLEECPVIMPMWAEMGYDFIIYPQKITHAMLTTYHLFVEQQYQDKAIWFALRFKSIATHHKDNSIELPSTIPQDI